MQHFSINTQIKINCNSLEIAYKAPWWKVVLIDCNQFLHKNSFVAGVWLQVSPYFLLQKRKHKHAHWRSETFWYSEGTSFGNCLAHRLKELRTQRTRNLRIKLDMNPHINLGKKKFFLFTYSKHWRKNSEIWGFINSTNHKLEKEDNFNIGQISFNLLFLKYYYLRKTTEKTRFLFWCIIHPHPRWL